MLWHMHLHLSSFLEGENSDYEKNVSGSCGNQALWSHWFCVLIHTHGSVDLQVSLLIGLKSVQAFACSEEASSKKGLSKVPVGSLQCELGCPVQAHGPGAMGAGEAAGPWPPWVWGILPGPQAGIGAGPGMAARQLTVQWQPGQSGGARQTQGLLRRSSPWVSAWVWMTGVHA